MLTLNACSVIPDVQTQINHHIREDNYDSAFRVLSNNESKYGSRNHLLYLLDRGLLLHYASQYQESIKVFEQAKARYDKLYTVSLTSQASTFLVNDNAAPYRGEDFERVLINVFQSMNFAALTDFEGALVEARDVDIKLRSMNRLYDQLQKENPDGQKTQLVRKNTYTQDAFARFIMGTLYEAMGSQTNLNDAFISYRKAYEIYKTDYQVNYQVNAPRLLKENLLATAEFMGTKEFNVYRKEFGDLDYVSLSTKQQMGQIYLVEYVGSSPIKQQTQIPIPLPDNRVTSIAFPYYVKRFSKRNVPSEFVAIDRNGDKISVNSEKGEDIGSIAVENLNNRKVRTVAKEAVRIAAKYQLSKEGEKIIERKFDQTGADWFKLGMNVYQMVSQQADLRSWQTLPDSIYISRLIVKPGEYQLMLNGREIGNVHLQSGEQRFFLIR